MLSRKAGKDSSGLQWKEWFLSHGGGGWIVKEKVVSAVLDLRLTLGLIESFCFEFNTQVVFVNLDFVYKIFSKYAADLYGNLFQKK